VSENRDDLNDEEFRRQLRNWLVRVYPEEWRDPSLRLRGEDARRWLRMQHEGGWRAPSWPREHGGLGLSLGKQIIFQQEMEHHAVARTLDHGVRMVGPILIRYGSPEQQRAYLPPILRGDHQWCQGYSEPGAGSDLANLKTSAVANGDAFIIRGQKIWTTQAADATHIYLLARTSTAGKKQEGITLFVVEMDTLGITVRPIKNLAEEEEFYEVFFDDVAVPKTAVVGAVDHGWRIAKALLGFERFSQGSPALARYSLDIARRVSRQANLEGNNHYADRLARLVCDVHDVSALFEDVCEAVTAGHESQDDYSIAKLASAELFQRITDCLVDMTGDAARAGPFSLDADLRNIARRLFLISRSVTIFGGTSEVQRNILSKSLLR
jgi:alkylation response protein AidB-like acyl-CoA dehydrogenase